MRRISFSAIGENASYSMAAMASPFSWSRTAPEKSAIAPATPEKSEANPWAGSIGCGVIWISIFISTSGYGWNQSDFICVGKPRLGIGILAVASQAGGFLKRREFRSG